MITSKNPVSVSVPREGSARFNVGTCCNTETGVLIMPKINYQKGQLVGETIYLNEVHPYILPSGKKLRKALFLCRCGSRFEARITFVKRGDIKSCGCYSKELKSKRFSKHKLSRHSLYSMWNGIKMRCYNPNNPGYANYGGRGIVMYDPWINNPEAFIEYCKTLPGWDDPNLSIDRKDNDGNYEPNNLRWVNNHMQVVNQRKRPNNTSGYTGVCYHRKLKKWVSKITVYKKTIYLGIHDEIEDAVDARNNYIRKNNLFEYKLQILNHDGKKHN